MWDFVNTVTHGSIFVYFIRLRCTNPKGYAPVARRKCQRIKKTYAPQCNNKDTRMKDGSKAWRKKEKKLDDKSTDLPARSINTLRNVGRSSATPRHPPLTAGRPACLRGNGASKASTIMVAPRTCSAMRVKSWPSFPSSQAPTGSDFFFSISVPR